MTAWEELEETERSRAAWPWRHVFLAMVLLIGWDFQEKEASCFLRGRMHVRCSTWYLDTCSDFLGS